MALNKNGFTRKTYSDILSEMEAKFQELFGEDINLSSYTPLGIIMRVMAFFYSKLWDVVEAVYNSRFIKKADGVSLDYHGGDKSLPRNPATYAYTMLKFTGEPGYVIETEEKFSTEGDVHFMLLEDVTLDELGNGSGEAVSVETGAFNNVEPNTITKQVEAVEQITSVTNPEKAKGGADRESNTSYRNRLLKANESNGKSTTSAIETAILNTAGVRSANVIFNKTMETDADGNPPKSIHAYVLGGATEDIGQALFNSIGATTQTVGEQVVYIKDNSGNTHEVRFDYAEVVQIFVRLTSTTNAEFESDGIDQLKNAMIAKIGGMDLNEEEQQGLSMGEDIILSQLFNAAYKVSGIDDITIEIGKDSLNLSASNIEITQKQVAELTADHIEVVVNA
ncbi:baseplate J/gp47 family protein [Peribacillus asahii]|uniref:baseplate J/gp47 family protein n=1 Tax=Peribacillus asahii TaxID=228899 RepID=UPI00207A417C|nr:baseplate J/gp47 family protein [Peribacillus asahii]USK71772.1 baseplate J/gp47 family protein [Peribacillus asahii]